MTFARALFTLFFCLTLGAHASPSADLGDTVSAPGVFSYQGPKGWTAKDTSMSKYPIVFDTPKAGFAPNINVVMQSFPKPLAEYVALNKSQLKSIPVLQNVIIVDEKPFQTTTGLTGIRMVITDTVGKSDLEQTFYFFEGPSDAKFVVTGSCLVGDAPKYAPIFDASMSTFSTK